MLRLNKKNFEDEEFPHVLILTTRETPEMRNAFANNMSADIKLSKSQIPNIIQSVRFSSNKCCYSFSQSKKAAVMPGIGFTLPILNEDKTDIIKFIKSLEDSSLLIDGATENVKHEIKKHKRTDSWSFDSTLCRFISVTSNFFSSKTYKQNRS